MAPILPISGAAGKLGAVQCRVAHFESGQVGAEGPPPTPAATIRSTVDNGAMDIGLAVYAVLAVLVFGASAAMGLGRRPKRGARTTRHRAETS